MPRRVGLLLGALVLFGASSAHSGDLRVSIYPPPPAPLSSGPPATPATAWEFPMPLLVAPPPRPPSLPRDLLAILVPKSAKKARGRSVKVSLEGGRARPSIAEAAPNARVSFAAREPVAIKFTFGVEKSLVASRRGTAMRFDKPGLYSFIGKDDPGLWGHVAVGSNVKMRKVPVLEEFVIRDLAPGPWEVFLVSGPDARSVGTVTLFGEGEETPCSFEYAP